MNVDNDRSRPGKSCRRHVEKTAYRFPIEALPTDQLSLGESLRVKTASLALRPAFYFAGANVQGINVHRRPGRCKIEAQVAPVLVPLDAGDNTQGQTRLRFL